MAQNEPRILVVDDEKNIRLTLGRALQTLGLDVVTAADGAEALERIEHASFGLVLLDLKMPGLDGFQTLRRIHRRRPHLPVIVFTAHGNAENAAEAMKLGAADFIRKPFTPEEIRALVRRFYHPHAQVETARQTVGPRSRRRIIVPVADPAGDHHLLRLAAASAHARADGELVAVHIIETPRQMPLRAAASDEEQSNRRYVLLNTLRESAGDLSIHLRMRTLAAHDVGAALLNVIREEKADHVLLSGPDAGDEGAQLSAATVQAVVRHAACEVTVVKLGDPEIRHVLALVPEGPHAPYAVRRAFEFGQSAGVATLTLLNVQQTAPEGEASPREVGTRLIHSVAEKAGLPDSKYEAHVVVNDDLRNVLTNAVGDYDTICMGASRSTSMAQSLFGSLPEMMRERAAATVAIARGPKYEERTILDAISERVSGRG